MDEQASKAKSQIAADRGEIVCGSFFELIDPKKWLHISKQKAASLTRIFVTRE